MVGFSIVKQLYKGRFMKKDARKEAMNAHNSRWERDVSDSVFPKANPNKQLDNWIAKNPKEWPRTHVKVTAQDY